MKQASPANQAGLASPAEILTNYIESLAQIGYGLKLAL